MTGVAHIFNMWLIPEINKFEEMAFFSLLSPFVIVIKSVCSHGWKERCSQRVALMGGGDKDPPDCLLMNDFLIDQLFQNQSLPAIDSGLINWLDFPPPSHLLCTFFHAKTSLCRPHQLNALGCLFFLVSWCSVKRRAGGGLDEVT